MYKYLSLLAVPAILAATQRITLDKLQSQKTPNDEQRLLQMLFDSYDRSTRPVLKASTTASVAVGLTLTHIFNIDEKKQVLSVNAWLEQEWFEERLVWDATAFGNVSDLTIPTSFVWTPDIVLYNNAIDFAQGLMQANVKVHADGTCFWAPSAKFRSMCKLDVTFFPFDHQVCQLRFASWIYDGMQVNLTQRSDRISMDSYTDNGEWDLIKSEVLRTVNYYSCCGDMPFPEIQFRIHLRRRTLFYLYNIILPCVMLSILVLVQFHLPCDCGEKVTFGLTVLLAYSVYSFKIAENMPETSDVVPLIAIYLVCTMAISGISVTFSVLVLSVHGGSLNQRRAPAWLRIMAFSCMAPCLCWTDKHPPQERLDALISNLREKDIHDKDNRIPIIVPSRKVAKPHILRPKRMIIDEIQATTLSAGDRARGRMQDILKDLQKNVVSSALKDVAFLKHELETESLVYELQTEWRCIARIFDKVCFWIASTLTGLMMLIMLVIAPLFSEGKLYQV